MGTVLDRRTLAGEATKERLLDAGERLFADGGLDGVSVRAIAAAAGVDLAMINYHFGSKEGLYRAVFHRRAGPLNALRLETLDHVLVASNGSPDVELVVFASVEPYLRLRNSPTLGGLPFSRLLVREAIDPMERERGILRENFDEVASRIVDAMSRALPGATRRGLIWAYHFMVGTLLLTMADTGRLEELSNGECKTADVKDVLRHIVPFIASGIRAALNREGSDEWLSRLDALRLHGGRS